MFYEAGCIKQTKQQVLKDYVGNKQLDIGISKKKKKHLQNPDALLA